MLGINTNKVYIGKIYKTYDITDKRIDGEFNIGPYTLPNIIGVSHVKYIKTSLLYKIDETSFVDILDQKEYGIDKEHLLNVPFICSKFPLIPFNDVVKNEKKFLSRKHILKYIRNIIIESKSEDIYETLLGIKNEKAKKIILVDGGSK